MSTCSFAASSVDKKHETEYATYCYQPCAVTLTGAIESHPGYGPPGFGEDPKVDRKVMYYILILKQPINVKSSNLFDAKASVKEVQLMFPYESRLYPIKKGKVLVSGQLQGPVSGMAVREVVLIVSSLKKIPDTVRGDGGN